MPLRNLEHCRFTDVQAPFPSPLRLNAYTRGPLSSLRENMPCAARRIQMVGGAC